MVSPMKLCPNPECRYRKRHGSAAEYRDQAATCSAAARRSSTLLQRLRRRWPRLRRAGRRSLAPPAAVRGLGEAGRDDRLLRRLDAGNPDAPARHLGPPASMQPSGGLLALFNVKVSAPQLS
jgi:hypothetical protein